ncbi:MAG: hypothetical protein R3E73_14890 [Porticoccaceae bacterium]
MSIGLQSSQNELRAGPAVCNESSPKIDNNNLDTADRDKKENHMKSRKTILATAVAGLLATQTVLGLGIGEIKQNSALNEPMDAEVEILGLGDLSELELLVDLGSKNDFVNAGVEREFFLTQLNFSVDLNDRQNPVVRITSKQPIREPIWIS